MKEKTLETLFFNFVGKQSNLVMDIRDIPDPRFTTSTRFLLKENPAKC
jgi:hypothetical protein